MQLLWYQSRFSLSAWPVHLLVGQFVAPQFVCAAVVSVCLRLCVLMVMGVDWGWYFAVGMCGSVEAGHVLVVAADEVFVLLIVVVV